MKPKTTNEIDIKVGRNIRARRVYLSMSQETLAEKCQVTFQQIQKYENATNRVSASRLVMIAAALGVKASDLLGDVDLSIDSVQIKLPSSSAMRIASLFDKIPNPSQKSAIGRLISSLAENGDERLIAAE